MQQLLFPDPQPLVERLGRDFFRALPECPGVYLMRDATDAVLYVGKAKNLRKRLGSYRVANPERLPRRHLRLLRAVVRIELEVCADETSALHREGELLRTLRPKFNRAGTWPASPRFLACRRAEETILLKIAETPEPGWQFAGPLGAGAFVLRAALVRLLWIALHPQPGLAGMPAGWVHGKLDSEAAVQCGSGGAATDVVLERLLSGEPEAFCEWVRAQLPPDVHAFDKTVVESDLEFIGDGFARLRGSPRA